MVLFNWSYFGYFWFIWCLTLSWRRSYHIDTNLLICSAYQWAGFYMIWTSVWKELMSAYLFSFTSQKYIISTWFAGYEDFVSYGAWRWVSRNMHTQQHYHPFYSCVVKNSWFWCSWTSFLVWWWRWQDRLLPHRRQSNLYFSLLMDFTRWRSFNSL